MITISPSQHCCHRIAGTKLQSQEWLAQNCWHNIAGTFCWCSSAGMRILTQNCWYKVADMPLVMSPEVNKNSKHYKERRRTTEILSLWKARHGTLQLLESDQVEGKLDGRINILDLITASFSASFSEEF